MSEPEFDSEEERIFNLYCDELKEAGYIKEFNYHPESFVLSEAVKYICKLKTKTKGGTKIKTLLREHIYTPDFYIVWDKKAKGLFYTNTQIYSDHPYGENLDDTFFIANELQFGIDDYSYIETKSSFNMQNMVREFFINQKWIWSKYNKYVQKVIPTASKGSCLFKETFVPKLALLTEKTKKPKKYNFPIRTLEEFVNEKTKG